MEGCPGYWGGTTSATAIVTSALKVHSHLVLGTLVLNPLPPSSRLGLKPPSLENFMLN